MLNQREIILKELQDFGENLYHKVVSSRLSLLVAHSSIFRLFMKGKFDAYVMWPLAQRVQNWIKTGLLQLYGMHLKITKFP